MIQSVPVGYAAAYSRGPRLLLAFLVALLLIPDRSAADPRAASTAPPVLELVETFPIETVLDQPDLPEAHLVWLDMIEHATTSLDFAEFYASNAPGSRLEPIVQAVEAAAARGVRVRFLAEEKFYRTYPGTLERLGAADGIEMRRFDVASCMGGVLHAKYFVVDGREAYLGSQNFDWRALEHIQELGVRIREPRVARTIADVFDTDWALAGGADSGHRTRSIDAAEHFPLRVASGGDTLAITPVFSPTGWLPDESLWDLPRLVELIDGAESTVFLQLLSYKAITRDGDYYERFESALRRAAARGVDVRLQLAHWSQRSGTIEGLQSLQAIRGIAVKLVTIPDWSGGFVPYGRVVHAKYLVVDGRAAWLGTSNWEKDYFHASRNVGLIVEGSSFAARLDAYFLNGWDGPYAEPVDPCAEYEAPRIGR